MAYSILSVSVVLRFKIRPYGLIDPLEVTLDYPVNEVEIAAPSVNEVTVL